MFIDTHGHVNFNAFRDDSNEVLRRTLENNTWVVMPGTQYSTSKRAVEIAEGFDRGVYAAVGLHPIHLGEQRKVDVMEVQSLPPAQDKQSWEEFVTRSEEFDIEKYRELTKSKKTVAIGEFGLDYYYRPKGKAKLEAFKAKQKEVFLKQLELAVETNLPVILHCRVAHEDMLELLTTNYKLKTKNLSGVVHCFTGTVEQAQKFMALGLYIGFNGLILKDVPALPNPGEVISAIPLERIVLETDSPYLTPPMAGIERNEPLFVKYVAEEIARIKKMSVQEVAEATTQNAKTLFILPGE
ncbi:MAG TPA: TatD family hydrolase [Candidatus Paceibacterota bacterium]